MIHVNYQILKLQGVHEGFKCMGGFILVVCYLYISHTQTHTHYQDLLGSLKPKEQKGIVMIV